MQSTVEDQSKWPAEDRGKSRRIQSGILILVLISGLILIYFFNPQQHSFYGKCLFKKITDLECAGCGTLRGTHALLHGDFIRAFRLNALLVISLPVLFTGLAVELNWLNPHSLPGRIYRFLAGWKAIVAVLIGWMVFRNLI